MEPAGISLTQLGTILALVLGGVATACSGFSWYRSRGARVSAFERLMADNQGNVIRRLEAMETRMVEYKSTMESLLDQADDLYARSRKERARVAQANVRAEAGSQAEPDISTLPRAAQLELVKRRFAQ